MRIDSHSCSSALILGLVSALTCNVLPAQARVDGADIVLDNCAEQGPIEFLEKCDPNADLVQDSTNLPSNQPGLQGSFNIRPLGAPSGLALEGTGIIDLEGNDLNNIDFSGPSQVERVSDTPEVILNPEGDPGAIGEFDILSSTLDFAELLGWKGTIKDLVVLKEIGAFSGEVIPGTVENPRIKNFMVINEPNEPGTGIIDGWSYGGVALDLVSLSAPSYNPANGGDSGTSMSLQMELQAYKLDEQGNRLEEQEKLPFGSPIIYANRVSARLSAAFALPVDEVKDNLDEVGELLAWYGYDVTFNSEPLNLFSIGEPIPGGSGVSGDDPSAIPEPTTLISSLLLFGGGVFKLGKRKQLNVKN